MGDCDCYNGIHEFVKGYAEAQASEEESIKVTLHKEWLSDHCYISLNYDTIKDKKHISDFAHLDPYFLKNTISNDCVKLIIDDILKRWRTKDGESR